MKLRTHFIACAFALLLAGNMHGQTLDTSWAVSSGAYEYSGNWSGNQPNIALGYFNNIDDFGNQYAGIDNGGTALVTTADTTSATADQLFVGVTNGNSGNLTVQDGGILTVHSLTIGSSAGSTGYATVMGTGSKITGPDAAILVGAYGTGSLTISSGGTVDIGMTVGWQTGSAGTVLVTGANSSAIQITGGSGTATITITDLANVVYQVSGGQGTTDITVSNYASVSSGISGGFGTNSNTHVTITDHASVSGGVSSSPVGAPQNMDVTISDSATVSGGIDLHGAGTNSFTINTGGALTDGGISLYASGSATGTIDSGAHTADGGVYVSGTGTNTFTLQNHASLDSVDSTSYIGDNSGETGTVTLTGGSSWTSVGDLFVGNSGAGALNIQGTSTVSLSNLYIGNNSDGNGTVNVDGSGSSLTAATITIGSSGSGALNITGGGQVTSGSNISMAGNGASGSITLTDNGQLTINGDGYLILNSEGGFGTLNIGADGGFPAALPGILDAVGVSGAGNAGGGSAVLVFNHTGNPYFFSPVITGGVSVVHKAGTTVLTGANDYSGGTTIMGGTLAIANPDALGTGDINFDGGTLDLNNLSQTSGLLNVLSNSFIDFSSLGNSAIYFADSYGITWSGTLTLLNFDGGDIFQVGGGGLDSAQLLLIDINGHIAQIDGLGNITESSTPFTAPAVPEPSTYAALTGAAALGFAVWRHRKTVVVARC